MSNKTKNIILIILGFLLSLFLFALFIGCGTVNSTMETAIENNWDGGPFIAVGSFILVGLLHCIFIGIIAIIAWFTNINKTYKKILAYLPAFSIILFMPISAFAMCFATFFHLFCFGG